MLRSAIAIAACTGLLAVASDALACPPSPPEYWAPIAQATDPTLLVPIDAGFVFVGEKRIGPETGFRVEVRSAATGEVVAGTLNTGYYFGDRLAWVPAQLLAAITEYSIAVKSAPPASTLNPLPAPVKETLTTFRTSDAAMPAIHIADNLRAKLRTKVAVPERCLGPCGPMTGPCQPVQLLFADVEVPMISGGAAAHGYQVMITTWQGRPDPNQAEGRSRVAYARAEANTPKQWTIELEHVVPNDEVCFQLETHDIAQHEQTEPEVCLDKSEVVAVWEGGQQRTVMMAAAGRSGTPAAGAGQAGSLAPDPGKVVLANAGHSGSMQAEAGHSGSMSPASRTPSNQHAKACSVASPGGGSARAHAWWLTLALPVTLRARRKRARPRSV